MLITDITVISLSESFPLLMAANIAIGIAIIFSNINMGNIRESDTHIDLQIKVPIFSFDSNVVPKLKIEINGNFVEKFTNSFIELRKRELKKLVLGLKKLTDFILESSMAMIFISSH